MHPGTLVFVHLSDLHIRSEDLQGGQERDADLRNELREDLQRVRTHVGTPHGILIGGDVAYAGKDVEYEYAVKWLRNLCESLDIVREHVWTVPGNHDVDRGVIQNSMIIQTVHANFRRIPELSLNNVDDLLRNYLVKDALGHTLLDPIAAYNRFASRFGCPSQHDSLFWEHDFTLNDGSTLRLRGVNSAVISDSTDDTGVNRLALGSNQATMPRQAGIAYMLLCHHPPADWLLNADSIEDLINNRAAVQLFGHKHRQRAWRIENVVRIQAGALHPDRKEGDWDPRYNVLEIWVEGEGDARQLAVRVWPRRWNPATQAFHPDAGESGQLYWERRVPLQPWSKPFLPDSVAGSMQATQDEVPGIVEDPMDRIRELAYDFFDLPYLDRMEIIIRLHLLRAEDRGLSEAEQEARVLRRVQEEDGMAEKFAAAIRARGPRL